MKYLGAVSISATVASNQGFAASHGDAPLEGAESNDKLPSLEVPAGGNLPVAVVIGKDAEVLDFCGPLEVLSGAWTKDGNPLFKPYMVAGTLEPVVVGAGMKVVPDYTFKNAPAPKLIVIPAMNTAGMPSDMFDWIREASANTDITMSVCNGAFVLAKTGLLDGKRCTAHHGSYLRFAGTFPKVNLVRGVRWVEEGKFASAGGISCGVDLSLRVVERYLGTESARELADSMEYQGKGWLDPESNDAYAILPDFNEAHPICPMCRMDGDRSIKTTHKGKNYYFCAKSEKEFFDSHLDAFDRLLDEDAKRAVSTKK